MPVFGGANYSFVYYSHTTAHCQPNKTGRFLCTLHKYKPLFANKVSAQTAKIRTGSFYDFFVKTGRFFRKLPQDIGNALPNLAELQVKRANKYQIWKQKRESAIFAKNLCNRLKLPSPRWIKTPEKEGDTPRNGEKKVFSRE